MSTTEELEVKREGLNRRIMGNALRIAFAHDVKSHEQFLEHFPPSALMEEFLKSDEDAELRGIILAKTVYMPEKTARGLPAFVAGHILQTAYKEREKDATAEFIVATDTGSKNARVTPAMWAERIPATALWSFITHGDWWEVGNAAQNENVQTDLITYALEHDMLMPDSVIDRIGIRQLTNELTKDEVEELVSDALKIGTRNKAYAGRYIVDLLKIPRIVQVMGSSIIHTKVIAPWAETMGLTDKPVVAAAAAQGSPPTVAEPGRKRTRTLAHGETPPDDKSADQGWSSPPGTGVDESPQTQALGSKS